MPVRVVGSSRIGRQLRTTVGRYAGRFVQQVRASHRSHRRGPAIAAGRPGPALPPDIAVVELELNRGSQFDPEIVDCFLTILDTADETYRRGQEADFHVEVQAVKFLHNLPDLQDEDDMAY